MNRIAVYCGSSSGKEGKYQEQANALGQMLAKENIELVYGGANVGLMGAVANGVLSKNGIVLGVLPAFLKSKEIAHQEVTQLIIVDTMHERKEKMAELCDGVIALPGGFGTLEELFEMLTWGQLNLHTKPIGLLNIDGFYDDLIQLMDKMLDKGFLKESNRDMLLVSQDIETLLNKMRQYKAPTGGKWIKTI